MYVRDLDKNEYPMMATVTIIDEVNGEMSLLATLQPNKPNLVFLSNLSEFWELVTDDEVVYKIILCEAEGEGYTLHKSIKAVPKAYDDLKRTRVYERYEGSYAVDELIRIIFKPTDYSYRLLGNWNNIRIEGFGDGDDCLSMLKHVLGRIDAEFYFTGNSFTIQERIGSETEIMYRHKLNASNIVHTIDGEDYYTFARGYGDYREDDKGWENAKLVKEYSSPLLKLIGKREAPPIKNANIKSATLMMENLQKLVDNSIRISVSADLIDLRLQNYPYAQSNLGDTVFLIDERINLNESVRVVKREITKNWRGRIVDLNFTFGSQGLVDRYISKTSTAVNTFVDILEGRKKMPFAAMAHEIQIVTGLMLNIQTQFEIAENGSILAIDKSNPNNVVIYNANGLFVSTDGGKTPKSAITARGIMGEAIIANSVTADKLEANAITVGFNNSSTNVKLFSNRIEFYANSRKTAELDDRGMTFWYGTRQIGDLGEGQKLGQPNIRGINMRLHTQGDYISWSHLKNINDDAYTVMMTMDPYGRMTGWKGIDVGMKMRVRDNDDYTHELHDALQVGTQFKGLSLAIATSFAGDGTATSWYNFKF